MHKYSEFLKRVKDSKRAFSLAEVNIVLALIGIVTVLAISTLQLSAKAQYPTARLVFKNDLATALAEMNMNYNLSDINSTADFIDKFKNYYEMPNIQPGSENVNIASTGNGPKPEFANSYKDAAGNTVNFKPYDVEFKTANGISVRLSYVNAGKSSYTDKEGNLATTKKSLSFAVDSTKIDRANSSYEVSNAALNYVTGYFDINGAKGPNKIGEDVGLIMPAYALDKSKQQYYTLDSNGNFMVGSKKPGEPTYTIVKDNKFDPPVDPNNPNNPNTPCEGNIIPDDYGDCKICSLTKAKCEAEGKNLNKKACACEFNVSCPKGKIQDSSGKCVCKNDKPALPTQGVFAEKDSEGNYLWNLDTCSYKCEIGANLKCMANGGTWNNETCSCSCGTKTCDNMSPYAISNPNNYCACTCDEATFNSKIGADASDISTYTDASGKPQKFHRTLYSKSASNNCFACHAPTTDYSISTNPTTMEYIRNTKDYNCVHSCDYSDKKFKTDTSTHYCVPQKMYDKLPPNQKENISRDNICKDKDLPEICTACSLTADTCKELYKKELTNNLSNIYATNVNIDKKNEPCKNKDRKCGCVDANGNTRKDCYSAIPSKFNYDTCTTSGTKKINDDCMKTPIFNICSKTHYLCSKGGVYSSWRDAEKNYSGSSDANLCTTDSKNDITFEVDKSTCSCKISGYGKLVPAQRYNFVCHGNCHYRVGWHCDVERHGEMTISRGNGTSYTIQNFLIREDCSQDYDPIVMYIPNKNDSYIDPNITIKGMIEDPTTHKCIFDNNTVTTTLNNKETTSTWLGMTNIDNYYFLVKKDKAVSNRGTILNTKDVLFTDIDFSNGILDLANYNNVYDATTNKATSKVVNELSLNYNNLALWSDLNKDAKVGTNELNTDTENVSKWPIVIEVYLTPTKVSSDTGVAEKMCGAIKSIQGYFKAAYPIPTLNANYTWLERVNNGNAIEYRRYEQDANGHLVVTATYTRSGESYQSGYSYQSYNLTSGNDTLGLSGNKGGNNIKVYVTRNGQKYEVRDSALKLVDILFTGK